MKLLLSLTVVVASVSAAPRYLVIPVEDVDFSNFAGRTLPVVRIPGLSRHARQVEDKPAEFTGGFSEELGDSRGAGSSPYAAPHAAPAHTGPDHVDYGAYTGGYGAFGWYTDHPVLLATLTSVPTTFASAANNDSTVIITEFII